MGRAALCLGMILIASTSWAQDSKQTTSQANDSGCSDSHGLLDWQDGSATGETTHAQRSQRCGGRYADPLAGVDTSVDPASQPIEASGTESEIRENEVRLSGGVQAQQGYRQIRAVEAEFNRETGVGSLHGDVELREPGLFMRGATGTLNSDSGEATLTASQFVLHQRHIHGGADLITRHGNGNIDMDDAYYSYCPPQQHEWLLRAEDISLDLAEGVGTARDATIELGGIPILYTPYLEFPLDDRRKSGFLWAELGHDSNGGVDIATPYYFNLAPNYDATLTPRYIADRGLLTEVEGRFLGENTGYWELGGAWISGDDGYQEDFPDDDGDRWLTAVEQQGLFAKRWRTEIDYTNVSDNDYFRDLGTTSLEIQQSTYINQTGQVSYLGDNWLTEVRLEEYKTISRDITRDPYRKLPQITLSRYAAERDFEPNLLLQSDYAYFDHDTDVTGHRLYNSIGASYPMRWIWGYLKPTAKYRQINYDLDDAVNFNPQGNASPDAGAPLLNLDAGLFFERDLQWGETSYLQTLEPRLYYLWADREDQADLPDFDTSELTFTYDQLFRETRFSGRDRLDDANQVSLGLTTRIIDPLSGNERLTASIGQIYYFDDRLVNVGKPSEVDFEGSSSIAAEFNVAPVDELSFRSSWLWNTDNSELDQTYLQLSYQGPRQHIFNVGYNYRRYLGNDPTQSDIEQIDVATYLPLNNEWSVFLASLYDLEESDRINDMAGIEYNNCCWRVRLVYQRHLDQSNNTVDRSLAEHENATYLEFQLKGLGGIGNRVTGLLEEVIRGYTDSDD
jgi:LPS-assembly protein